MLGRSLGCLPSLVYKSCAREGLQRLATACPSSCASAANRSTFLPVSQTIGQVAWRGSRFGFPMKKGKNARARQIAHEKEMTAMQIAMISPVKKDEPDPEEVEQTIREADEAAAAKALTMDEEEEVPWAYDKPSDHVYDDEMEEDREPTPILDAYEKSRDPKEMERLIQLSYDCLPVRTGPRRHNHKRREHQRFRIIRNIKYKIKAQKKAAMERNIQKRRDKKKWEEELFATWRNPQGAAADDGETNKATA